MSVNMLKYLFKNQVDSNAFWNLIEDYFQEKFQII